MPQIAVSENYKENQDKLLHPGDENSIIISKIEDKKLRQALELLDGDNDNDIDAWEVLRLKNMEKWYKRSAMLLALICVALVVVMFAVSFGAAELSKEFHADDETKDSGSSRRRFLNQGAGGESLDNHKDTTLVDKEGKGIKVGGYDDITMPNGCGSSFMGQLAEPIVYRARRRRARRRRRLGHPEKKKAPAYPQKINRELNFDKVSIKRRLSVETNETCTDYDATIIQIFNDVGMAVSGCADNTVLNFCDHPDHGSAVQEICQCACAWVDEQVMCVAFEEFDAGYGDCDTYHPGNGNHDWCADDFDDKTGLSAQQACSGCGHCVAPPPLPQCEHYPEHFDAGFGTCDTYAEGQENQNNCESHFDDRMGLFAMDICSECGQCHPPPPKCEGDHSEFDVGYGGCDTYGPGTSNHGYCSMDYDDETGWFAEDVCTSCGMCHIEPDIVTAYLILYQDEHCTTNPMHVHTEEVPLEYCIQENEDESMMFICEQDGQVSHKKFSDNNCQQMKEEMTYFHGACFNHHDKHNTYFMTAEMEGACQPEGFSKWWQSEDYDYHDYSDYHGGEGEGEGEDYDYQNFFDYQEMKAKKAEYGDGECLCEGEEFFSEKEIEGEGWEGLYCMDEVIHVCDDWMEHVDDYEDLEEAIHYVRGQCCGGKWAPPQEGQKMGNETTYESQPMDEAAAAEVKSNVVLDDVFAISCDFTPEAIMSMCPDYETSENDEFYELTFDNNKWIRDIVPHYGSGVKIAYEQETICGKHVKLEVMADNGVDTILFHYETAGGYPMTLDMTGNCWVDIHITSAEAFAHSKELNQEREDDCESFIDVYGEQEENPLPSVVSNVTVEVADLPEESGSGSNDEWIGQAGSESQAVVDVATNNTDHAGSAPNNITGGEIVADDLYFIDYTTVEPEPSTTAGSR